MPIPSSTHDALPANLPRTALVTGGGKRIGRAISLALAQAGVAVAIHCRARDAATEATATACRDFGVRAELFTADLSNEAETEALAAAALAAMGPLGVLVNNASLFERDAWQDATRTSWDRHMLTNLRAPFVLTQAFARALPASAEGVVINIIDQRVWSLTPHFVSYTLSKAGLWTLTQTMALALAPRIRVNAIGPGPTLPSPRQSPEQFALQQAQLPLPGGTTPEEIGRAILGIIGLKSLTGQMLALDGGQHMNWYPPTARQTRPDE